jgi:hypothetical protein
VEVSRSHTHTHTHFLTHSLTHSLTPGRTPVNKRSARCRGRYRHNTQQTQQTNSHALSGIRTRDFDSQIASDLCLTPHCHRDRPIDLTVQQIIEKKCKQAYIAPLLKYRQCTAYVESSRNVMAHGNAREWK